MKKEEPSKIDKKSDKYKVVLKLVNKLLVAIGKKKIKNLEEFVDIDREDIIKNEQVLNDMEDELFKLFDRKKSGYDRKTKSLFINCLRRLLKELGYSFVNKKKEKSEYIDGKSFKRTHMIYSVKVEEL